MSEEFGPLAPPRTFRIVDRIELGLERMAARGMVVRSINLTEEDEAALEDALSKHWHRLSGSEARVIPCSYKGHPIRKARNARNISSIYSKHGVGINLPDPRESRRTK